MVLNEYARHFFLFVKTASKIDAMERLKMINVVSMPHMKKADSDKIIRSLKRVLDDEEATPEQIKLDRERLMRKLKGKLV